MSKDTQSNTNVAKDVDSFFLVRQGMSDEEQIAFSQYLEPQSFNDKTEIVQYNENDDNGMYIITEGRALVKDAEGNVINELNAGDYFGELALLMNDKRSTTVEADGHMETLHIPKDVYMALIEKNPRNQGYLFANLYTKISSRYQKLVELTNKQTRYLQMLKIFPIFLFVMFLSRFLVAAPNTVLSMISSAIIELGMFIIAFAVSKISLKDLGLVKGKISILSVVIAAASTFFMCGAMFLIKNLMVPQAGVDAAAIAKMGFTVLFYLYVSALIILFMPPALQTIQNTKGSLIRPSILPTIIATLFVTIQMMSMATDETIKYCVLAIVITFASTLSLCCLRIKYKSSLGIVIGCTSGAVILIILRIFVFAF